jgi:hypothetical protein
MTDKAQTERNMHYSTSISGETFPTIGKHEGKSQFWSVFDCAKHYVAALMHGRIDYQYGWPEFRGGDARLGYVTLHWFLFGAPTADDARMRSVRMRFGNML